MIEFLTSHGWTVDLCNLGVTLTRGDAVGNYSSLRAAYVAIKGFKGIEGRPN